MQHSLWNMYSCIQNGLLVNKKSILFPVNRFCQPILTILYKEGYINGFRNAPKEENKIEIFLKYTNSKAVIQGLRAPSKPGRRLYSSTKGLWKTNSSLITTVLSTSKGLYNDRDGRRFRCGGELLAVLR